MTTTLPEGANEERVVGDDRDPKNYNKKGIARSAPGIGSRR